MKTRTLLVAMTAATVALGLVGCSTSTTPSGSQTGSPIKIGMVAPLTGPYSPLGQGALAAVKSEVARINKAGGMDGHQVELVYKDDQSVPDQSVVAFNSIASDPSVVAMLSSSAVANSTATGPAALRAKIPTISLAPIFQFEDGSNPYVFTVPASSGLAVGELIAYFKANDIKTLAVAGSNDPYGIGGTAATVAAAKAAGITIVDNESFAPTTTDFSALLTHVKAADPDGLLFWGAGASAVIATKQYATFGLKAPLFMTGAEASPLYTAPAADAANGVVMSSSIAVAGAELPTSKVKSAIDAFAIPFEKSTGSYPAQFAFDGASGVALLQAAITKANATSRADILTALSTLSALTPNGRYTYSATDHMGLSAAAETVVVVKDGKFVATPYAVSTFPTKTK